MPHPDVFTVLVTASNRNHNQDRYGYHNYAITNYYHCSCEVMAEPPSAEPTLQMWRMLTVQRSQCTRNRSTHLVVLTISKHCFTKIELRHIYTNTVGTELARAHFASEPALVHAVEKAGVEFSRATLL